MPRPTRPEYEVTELGRYLLCQLPADATTCIDTMLNVGTGGVYLAWMIDMRILRDTSVFGVGCYIGRAITCQACLHCPGGLVHSLPTIGNSSHKIQHFSLPRGHFVAPCDY